MRRTQIYLDPKLIQLLNRLSVKTGKTRSELIRDALRDVYAQNDVKDTVRKIIGLQSFADYEFSRKVDEFRKERKW